MGGSECASGGEPGRGGACSITGGYVCRGAAILALRGRYVFGDFCTGTIWSIPAGAGEPHDRVPETLIESGVRISGFGEDYVGELYMTAIDRGVLYKLEPTPDVVTGKRQHE